MNAALRTTHTQTEGQLVTWRGCGHAGSGFRTHPRIRRATPRCRNLSAAEEGFFSDPLFIFHKKLYLTQSSNTLWSNILWPKKALTWHVEFNVIWLYLFGTIIIMLRWHVRRSNMCSRNTTTGITRVCLHSYSLFMLNFIFKGQNLIRKQDSKHSKVFT